MSLLIFNDIVQQHFLSQPLACDQFQVTSKTCAMDLVTTVVDLLIRNVMWVAFCH
jgi:hypothetical protein